MESPRVGIASFADSRTDQALQSEAYQYIKNSHLALADGMKARGFHVVDPAADALATTGTFSPITTLQEREATIRLFQQNNVEAIIIGCWRWSEPMPIVDLVRSLNVPTALFGHRNADWSGFGGITAIGAALWEVSPNRPALTHARVLDDLDELARWGRGVCAYQRLRRARLLLWGGSLCMGMEHLLDDLSRLKAWLIGDILGEGQYYLIKRAEAFLQERHEIQAFLDWLRTNGTHIIYDDKMLTNESLARQIALYLAAEQRIDEIGRDTLAGVSVLCHKELSVEYGVTPCLIPALVPFPENHRGPKRPIPTVCEGDVKSLITSVLMNDISPETPVQFGDLREINDAPNWIVIANCGGSSLFYAANSNRAADALPNVTLQHQIHGVSGASVTFRGKATAATVARLCRVRGQYSMHLGVGQTIDVTDEIMNRRKWAREWPTVVVDLGVRTDAFARVAASNHYCLIPGYHTREIGYACAQAGLPVFRIDTEPGIEQAVAAMTAVDSILP
jgi:L-fucose/D-arabinose isomerase